jgi:hypothetical protein
MLCVGDDEQSDFYAEPESSVRMSTALYTCCDGSSNSKPSMNRTTSRDSDSEYAGLVPVDFNAYFAGNWDTLSADSQNQFKARFKLLVCNVLLLLLIALIDLLALFSSSICDSCSR